MVTVVMTTPAMMASDQFAESLIARRAGLDTVLGDWQAWGSGCSGQQDIGSRPA